MKKITEIIQTPLFASRKKKLHKGQIIDLDDNIRRIIENPDIGDLKSGPLKGIRVLKYKSNNNLILLAYEVLENILYLYALGSHENFYRNLQKYLDS